MKTFCGAFLFIFLFSIPSYGDANSDISIMILANRVSDIILAEYHNPKVVLSFREDFPIDSGRLIYIKEQLIYFLRNRIHLIEIAPTQHLHNTSEAKETVNIYVSITFYINNGFICYLVEIKDSQNNILDRIADKFIFPEASLLKTLRNYATEYGPLVGVLIVVPYYISRVRSGRKAIYANVASLIIEKFSNPDITRARGNIYKQNLNFKSEDDYKSRFDASRHRDIDAVLSSFDEAGLLITRRLMPKEYLLPMYWEPTVMGYYKLSDYITKVKWRRFPVANLHFVALAKRASDYWNQFHPKQIIFLKDYDVSGKIKEEKITSEDFEKKIDIDIKELLPRIPWRERVRLFRRDNYLLLTGRCLSRKVKIKAFL